MTERAHNPPRLVLSSVVGHRNEIHHPRVGQRLMDYIMERWPEGFAPLLPALYRDRVSQETRCDPEKSEDIVCAPGDHYILLLTPSGGVVKSVVKLVAKVFDAVVDFFGVSPEEEEFDDRQSENAGVNRLKDKRNLVRTGSRTPEHFGTRVIYPDLMLPPRQIYSGRDVRQDLLYCIGTGDYKIFDETVSLGDTPIYSIPPYSKNSKPWTVIRPDEEIPGDFLVYVKSSGLKRQELEAPNVELEDIRLNFRSGNQIHAYVDIWNSVGVPGDLFYIAGAGSQTGWYEIVSIHDDGPGGQGRWYVVVTEPVSGGNIDGCTIKPGRLKGKREPEILAVTADSFELWSYVGGYEEAQVLTIEESPVGMNGNYDLVGTQRRLRPVDVYDNRLGGYVTRNVRTRIYYCENADGSSPGWTPRPYEKDNAIRGTKISKWTTTSGTIEGGGEANATAWIALPELCNRFEFTLEFPKGLYERSANSRAVNRTVSLLVEWRRQDNPNVVVGSQTIEYTLDETNGIAFTENVYIGASRTFTDLWDVRFKRLTDKSYSDDPVQVDDMFLTSVGSLLFMETKSHPNVTLIALAIEGSDGIIEQDTEKFNLKATRRLPTYNRRQRRVNYNLRATESFADALLHTVLATDSGNYKDADCDFDQLYQIEADLEKIDGGNQIRFCHVFDQKLSFEDQMTTIANIARVSVYKVGNRIHFSRDRGGIEPVSVFSDRAKAPGAEGMSFLMQSPDTYDGVSLRWYDEENDWLETHVVVPVSRFPRNPYRMTLVGSVNWAQAYRRALYEWDRIQYQRDTLTITTTDEAQILGINDAILNVDGLAFERNLGGEVVDITANIVTVDREVNILGSGNDLILRDRDGKGIETLPIVQQTAPNKIALQNPPQMAVDLDERAQRHLLFSIEKTAMADCNCYLVKDIVPTEGYVRLQCVNYNELQYASDTGPLLSREDYIRKHKPRLIISNRIYN